MATVSRLSMVILMQQDIEKAVQFYHALGCSIRFTLPGQWAELVLEDIIIGLCPTDQPSEPRRTGLVFAVDDVKEFYETHKDTYQFIHEPVIKTHGGMASMQDPHGNIIDVYQATPEKVQEALKKEGTKQPVGCCKGSPSDMQQCCQK